MSRIVAPFILIFLAALIFLSCQKDSSVSPKQNIPPKTFLWIQIDTSKQLAPVISRQSIRWWGEDPDGIVKGFLFAFYKTDSVQGNQVPDTLGYTWVTGNDSLVSFPLLSAKERFTVIVRAVDNTLKDSISVGGIVRLNPQPYWDKNCNNIYDHDDLLLSNLKYAIDPTGAKQIFSIKNSRPRVEFAKDPFDPTKTIQQPETTFTVATFTWVGSDTDGVNTLKAYRINLNHPEADTAWFEFSAKYTMITLEVPRSRSDARSDYDTSAVDADVYSGSFPIMKKIGTVQGLYLDRLNKIYLEAKDLAGEYSNMVSLPDGNNTWYIRKPKSSLLTIVNYDLPVPDTAIIRFYRSAFAAIDNMPGVSYPRNLGNFDVLDIRRGTTDKTVGELVPPNLNPAFVRTLMLYKCVFWFTDYIPDNWTHVHSIAQYPLYLYTGAGGKVLYSTRFGYYLGDPRGSLVDFAPVDHIIDTLFSTRVPNDWPIDPSSTDPDSFPRLRFSPGPTAGYSYTIFVRDFIKEAGADYIYSITLPGTTRKINIGVIDVNKQFVFLSLPLNIMNGYERKWPSKPPGDGLGVSAFLKRVFIDEFGE